MKDRGSILPLIAGLMVLCGVFVVGVIDSTDFAITRTRLQSVADGAALAAAGTVMPADAALSNGQLRVVLSSTNVSRVARQFVRDSAVNGIRVRAATSPDRRTAIVTLTQTWRAPLDSDFVPIRVRLTATARARTIFD
ncbi:MAG: hypothetical protein RLZZ587_119 [Actinomycetota bacterium]|jgi:uncharacterized membrane protein